MNNEDQKAVPAAPENQAVPETNHCYLINLVSIVLIITGALIILAPVASDYHQRTLVANVIPYLWSEAHRQGDDAPSTNEINEIEFKLDKGTGLSCHYSTGCFWLGSVMIIAGLIPTAVFLNHSLKKR